MAAAATPTSRWRMDMRSNAGESRSRAASEPGMRVRRYIGAWVVAAMLAALPAAAGRAPAPPSTPSAAHTPLIAVLCYHDLSNDPDADLQTVSSHFLTEQIRSCKQA